MSTSFNAVESFVKKISIDLKQILRSLDELIREGCDNDNVPIYFIKDRIKTPESVFLKTKRRNKKLNDITDYAGLRLICLFEQEIFEIQVLLLKILKKNGYRLVEAEMKSWDKEDSYTKALEKYFNENVRSVQMQVPLISKSGYKSIHYLCKKKIGNKYYSVEIQLRTLFQDVWAELGHTLAYKQGNVHPHIQESIKLLARDLETHDRLINHLKDVRDKERFGELYSYAKAGPQKHFDYEPSLLPKLFQSGKISEAYEEYIKFIRGVNPRTEKDRINKARSLYKKICDSISVSQANYKNVNYFIKMEDAFLKFCEGKIDKAMQIYEELLNDNKESYKDYYCLHFRAGEIYFINGNIEKSLVSFDLSKKLISKNHHSLFENSYRIATKLAYTYWLLGDEYIDLVIKEIDNAEKILEKDPPLFKRMRYPHLNASCWYYLERALLNKDKNDFKIAKKKCKELEKYIKDPEASSNMFDTVAWFYYHSYRKNGDLKDLKLAKKYCRQIEGKENFSTLKDLSINMQRNHIIEIMDTK